MLFFSGSAFELSEPLYLSYSPFVNKERVAPSFFSIDATDELITFGELRKSCDNIYVGSTHLSRIDDTRMVVNHAGFRCITVPDFCRADINRDSLQSLTPAQFRNLNETLYQLARFRALYQDMLVLHASAIVYRDETIMFSGMKGAGKSTQARLWLENTDAWVLNYDKPVVKLDGDQVLVSGSPWGGKEDLSINEVRPAKALFFVHQARENRVVRLPSAKAYAEAHLNYFVYPLNDDIEKRYNDAIIQLVKKVPIYDLFCTDTVEAVAVVRKELYPEEE